MGLRMRRSIRLGPGVRLNLGKSGLGISAGVRGMRYSVHSSGRRTASLGIPGTGVSYVASLGSGHSRKARSPKAVAPRSTPTQAIVKQAGLFAPGYEKEFARAVEAFVRGDRERARNLFRNASAKDVQNKAVADDLLIGILEVQAGQAKAAIPYLEKVVASKVALPDTLLLKYLPAGGLELQITPLVRVALVWSSLLGALALAEAYQSEGRVDEAIGVLQQIHRTTADSALTLSLCELLSQRKAWNDVVELAAGVTNVDDLSLQIRLFQALALERTGLPKAAIEVYRDCLRSKKRDAKLLLEARYGRGRLLLAIGKRSAALRDLGLVYAAEPAYAEVATLVRSAQPEPSTPAPGTASVK
jgi:tetratricopeptide (TPR) repeat protein